MPAIVGEYLDKRQRGSVNSQVPLATYKQEEHGNSGGKVQKRDNVAMTPRVGVVWFDRLYRRLRHR